MVSESRLEPTEHGLVPKGDGWFVLDTVDEVASRHGVSVEQDTTDPKQAYARFTKREPTRYREGWLPE